MIPSSCYPPISAQKTVSTSRVSHGEGSIGVYISVGNSILILVENVPCFFSSKIRENESHEFKEKVHVAASLWDDAHKKYIS
jgi:hypothetical protein